jgi:predicted metal-dependent phosphotriesterase family hydrolase
MPHVETVRGPVDPAQLGRVLPHEHLQMLVPGPWLSGGEGDHRVDIAVAALERMRPFGFGTVVDLTPYEVGVRDLDALREISERSSVHIVAGSSIYLEPYSPAWALEADLAQLHRRFVHDATVGTGDAGIKVGIFGEQATSLNEITPHEEKCLRAAARAHADTGLALNTHTTHGTMAFEQLAILREEGADLSRVVIGHMDIQPDPAYVRRVLDSGVSVGFDTLGKQFWDFVLAPLPAEMPEGEFPKRAYFRPDAARIKEIADLAADGFAPQILMSMDMTGHEVYLNPRTHGQSGYSFLGDVVIPELKALGVSDADLEQMLVVNPRRLLTIN